MFITFAIFAKIMIFSHICIIIYHSVLYFLFFSQQRTLRRFPSARNEHTEELAWLTKSPASRTKFSASQVFLVSKFVLSINRGVYSHTGLTKKTQKSSRYTFA